MGRPTLQKGLEELSEPPLEGRRVRRAGGGRKKLADPSPGLKEALKALVAPETPGDPMSPLKWVSKSTRQLAAALKQKGFPATHTVIARLLHDLGFSLQANRKTHEGGDHPDRDAQFRYINKQVRAHLWAAQPVISVDCKKKELVGNYKNAGQEWQPTGQPEDVKVYDFVDPELGKAIPYGSTTWAETKDSSTSERTTTPQHSQLKAYVGGGTLSVSQPIPKPVVCSSAPTAAAATDLA